MWQEDYGTAMHAAEELTDGDQPTKEVTEYAERAIQAEERMAQMEEKLYLLDFFYHDFYCLHYIHGIVQAEQLCVDIFVAQFSVYALQIRQDVNRQRGAESFGGKASASVFP